MPQFVMANERDVSQIIKSIFMLIVEHAVGAIAQ